MDEAGGVTVLTEQLLLSRMIVRFGITENVPYSGLLALTFFFYERVSERERNKRFSIATCLLA